MTAPGPNGEFPPNITLEPVDPACTPGSGNELACSVEPLAAGGTAPPSRSGCGVPSQGRSRSPPTVAQGRPGESDTSNNTATHQITVTTPPDIHVTAAPTSFTALGSQTQTETITFTLSNTGSLPAANVTLVVESAGVGSDAGEVSLSKAETGSTCVQVGVASLRCQLRTIEGGASSQLPSSCPR